MKGLPTAYSSVCGTPAISKHSTAVGRYDASNANAQGVGEAIACDRVWVVRLQQAVVSLKGRVVWRLAKKPTLKKRGMKAAMV